MSLNTLSTTTSEPTVAPKRSYAWLLPVGLLLGFIAVLLLLFGKRLIPATEVTTASVQTVRLATSGSSTQTTKNPTQSAPATMLFQASGWVEPDPYITYVPTLVSGIVDKVEVLEGQKVKKGQLLATLIDEDAQLDFDQAKHQYTSLLATIDAHCAGLHITQAEIVAQQKKIEAIKSQLANAKDNVARLKNLQQGAVSKQSIIQAGLEYDNQVARVAEAEADIPRLNARYQQIELERDAMTAKLTELETAKQRAQLALNRTKISAPIDGIVLVLHAAPGKKRYIAMDDPNSAVIVELYDPKHLQARIDVPLSEAASMQVGQTVDLTSDLLPDTTFKGKVTRITGQADLQRNTLQAKVAIKNPDERLRPEMLVRGKFYSISKPLAPGSTASVGSAQRLAIYAPETAFVNETSIWVATPESTAQLRTIKLGSETRDGHRRVLEGLRSGEKVILPPHEELTEGTRIETTNKN